MLDVLRRQEDAGVDVVTDGELRRDNFFSFVAEKLDGVELYTLAEMLDLVEDKAAFELILQTLDAPAYAISNAVCVGKIALRRPLAVDDLRFAQRHTTRADQGHAAGAVPAHPRDVRAEGDQRRVPDQGGPRRRRRAGPARRRSRRWRAAGAAFIQLDEPVLTELVFTHGRTRTFMCAALAERGDPSEELELATHLMNEVLDGAALGDTRIGLHVCRGNWSRDESILLRGGYHPLAPWLERMTGVRQLVLEYATERAGDLMRFDRDRPDASSGSAS